MKHPVELAAQFIRRGDFVLANDVLRDEYGVEYGNPAQIRYCSIDPEDIIGKALERTARVFGCLMYRENDIFLTIVGEKEAIDKLEEVRLVALSDEYGYKDPLNRALSEADIAGIGREQFKKHYLGISDNVTYFVEQMDASSVDTFHYKVAFRPETILPDIDMQTSGDEN